MPKLYIAEPEGETLYEIFDDEVTLGRGAANGVQIADSHASKNHAVIRRLQGHWKVIDLESRNGVRVNGRFRNQHWLSDGDTLLIGTASLRYAAEGAPEGSPAAAQAASQGGGSGTAQPARAAPAPAAPAQPAPARAAVPGRPIPPPPPSAPAPAPAPAPAAPAPTRRAAAPVSARKRRPAYDEEGYDSEFDDMPPPRRRSSNSGTIVVVGIVSAIALIGIVWWLAAGGTPHNQLVWKKAAAMADGRDYEGALRYAEQHGDPDGSYYGTLLKAMRDWKKRVQARKDVERDKAARDHLDYQIYRKQAILERFRAKNALPDEEIVRLLREFLIKYRGTAAARELMTSEHHGYPELRDAMREYASEELKATAVLGKVQTELSILETRGMYGQVIQDLEFIRDMNRLCMTPENFKQLRNLVDDRIAEVKSNATVAFGEDKARFKKYRRDEQWGKTWQQLELMREKYDGIPELIRGIKELEAGL